MHIESKLPGVGTTIFTVMSAKATEVGAINLGQGFPDFAPDPLLLQLLTEALQKGHNQYAPMPGLLQLRQAIAAVSEQIYGVHINPNSEITITSGATEAIFDAVMAIVRPGDEVIVLEPTYDCYVPAIELAGGVPIRSKLVLPNYHVDWQDVENKITGKTRAIMINSPHNPTGAVWSATDLEQLERLTKNTSIFVISDEVYEHIVFPGHVHQSMLCNKNLTERSFVVGSFGKNLHVTGWKLGYCIAPEKLTYEFRKIHQFVTFASSHPMQWAIAEYLRQKPLFYEEIKSFYDHKRVLFESMMTQTKFKAVPTHGTYFQLFTYDAISDLPEKEFALWLVQNHGVAGIPVSAFYADGTNAHTIRFCFAKEDTTLINAAQKLAQII